MLHQSLYDLRDAFRNYLDIAPDIDAFCGSALRSDHRERHLDPNRLPLCENIGAMENMASPATQNLTSSVIAATPHLHWRQSYTLDDPGFDQHYLDNYGWFNLIAPSGPFVSDVLRLSVGFWGKGLHYPNHWHEPEEIYLTLAGSALYISDGRAPVEGGPGATICQFSNQPHSARFDKAPLLAAAFWRGDNLEAKSCLDNDE